VAVESYNDLMDDPDTLTVEMVTKPDLLGALLPEEAGPHIASFPSNG
jgi:hypothetical protein